MGLNYELLVDRPDLVPMVIDWWYTVWGDRMGPDRDKNIHQLASSLSSGDLPIHVLAVLNGIYVGSAALKLQELGDVYPSNKYWLGSVFVMEQYRGSRIASAMTMKIVKIARERNLPHLYLQTINLNGGLYSELGWQVIEQFNYKDEDTLLMMKTLGL